MAIPLLGARVGSALFGNTTRAASTGLLVGWFTNEAGDTVNPGGTGSDGYDIPILSQLGNDISTVMYLLLAFVGLIAVGQVVNWDV